MKKSSYMIKTVFYKILVVFLFASNTLFALNITPSTDFYVDTNNTLSFDIIKNNEMIKFTQIKKNTMNLGFSDSTFWLRYKIKNPTNATLRRYIVYTDPIVGELDIYFKDKVQHYGILRKHEIAYINPTFQIELKPNEEDYVYLRVFSDVTPINVALEIYDEHNLNKVEMTNHFVMAMFFGFLIALIVYNTSVYFSIRDKLYIYYVLYVISILIHHLGYKGFQQLYITPEANLFVFSHPVAIMDAFMITTMLLFTATFLQIKKFKKIYITFYVLAIALIINAIVMLYPPFYNLEVVFLWALLSLIIVIASAIYLVIKGVEHSKIYLLGWAPTIIMFILLLFRQIFGINILEHLPYFEEFAIAFEATIFSVALSLRIKSINEEKNEVKDKLLNFEQNAKQKLQTEVANKTKELNHRLEERCSLFRELNHRVKNNMQIIISMLRLQATKYGKHGKGIVQVAENRIRSMLFIHELLYEKSDNSTFSTKEYLTLLIEKIAYSISLQKESLSLSIEDIQIDNNRVVTLGFIINELLTNAIKHAKPKDEVSININLSKTNENIVLSVTDNGTFFDNESKDGLGTLFINTMVDEQLHGYINRKFDKGYKITINIPIKTEKVI